MKHIPTSQARADLQGLVLGVQRDQEAIVLTDGENDVAAIVSLEALKMLTAVFDELEDYPEHPNVPGHERLKYAEVRQQLGLGARTPDAARGASLISGGPPGQHRG